MKERLFFVPLGDTRYPHPGGVCQEALRFMRKLVEEYDKREEAVHLGCCRPCFPGMVWERWFDYTKTGYLTEGCVVEIKTLVSGKK